MMATASGGRIVAMDVVAAAIAVADGGRRKSLEVGVAISASRGQLVRDPYRRLEL